jgi:hypothetical protein
MQNFNDVQKSSEKSLKKSFKRLLNAQDKAFATNDELDYLYMNQAKIAYDINCDIYAKVLEIRELKQEKHIQNLKVIRLESQLFKIRKAKEEIRNLV